MMLSDMHASSTTATQATTTRAPNGESTRSRIPIVGELAALPGAERKTAPRALRRTTNGERDARFDDVNRACDVLEIFAEAARFGGASAQGRTKRTIADDPNGHRNRLGHGTFRRFDDDANELGIAGRVARSRTSQSASTMRAANR